MRRDRPSALDAWTDRDRALWQTCEIAADLLQGRPARPRQHIQPIFPPHLGVDEQFWAAGPYLLAEQRALGDGTYQHSGGFFFATGGFGLAATAAFAGAQAAGNARRRRQAEQDAIPRWMPVDQGVIYLSPYGLYLHGASGLHAWLYSTIVAAQMVAPGTVNIHAGTTSGTVSWLLTSDWAELLFVAWSMACHPRHPQMVGGAWLPPGWVQRCEEHGYSTRLTRPALEAGAAS